MAHPELYIGRKQPLWLPRSLTLKNGSIAAHKHVIGKTGQGKSKFLAHCFVELVSQGIACSLVDPHSDLADDVLGMLADRGLADDRLLFVDFGRRDRFVPFNVLRQPYPDDKVASIMVEACKRVWPTLADGSAPMFENVMLAGCRTLVQNHLPFAALYAVITDSRYRNELLANVTDPMVVHYFRATYDRLSARDQLDQTQSSLRRVFNLTFPEELRYTLGQTDNLLNFRDIMDSGKSAIYDLGGLEEETQRFLGALIAHGYEVASLSRSDTVETKRRPHHLFLDEFSMFSATTESSLGRILSLARKYKLTLWLAHQTWGQLPPKLANALQNTIKVAFAIGPDDARIIAPYFTNYDPEMIKTAEIEDAHTLRSFLGVQETYEKKATELKTLEPRHALVRYHKMQRHYLIGHKLHDVIAEVKTPTIRIATTREKIEDLREVYAQQYLRPREVVVGEVDGLLAAQSLASDNPPPGSNRT